MTEIVYIYHSEYSTYKIDGNNGLVYDSNHKLCQCVNNCGYLLWNFKANEGKRKIKTIHRFIYEAYHGKIPDNYEINHIDHNKNNNSINNLEALSVKEHRAKDRIGRIYNPIKRDKIKIKALCLADNVEIEYNSITQASKTLQVNPGMISYIINGNHPAGLHRARSKITGNFYTFSKN